MVLKYIIVLEGPDGVGKTTQGKMLVNYLTTLGVTSELVKARVKPKNCYTFITEIENAYVETTEKFPKWLKSTLMAYERAKQIYDIINNSTADVLIFDKYIYSTPLYLDYKGIDKEFAWKILRWLPNPDLVVFFDLDATVCMERIIARGEKIGNNENIPFLSLLIEKMPAIIESFGVPLKKINAAQESDVIFSELKSSINKLLGCEGIDKM